MLAILVAILLFAPLSQAQVRKDKACRYEIRFDQQAALAEPLRLTGKTRTASLTFYTERTRVPADGSQIHLFLRHSPNLDATRSFISISLNYGLLRSLRLDYGTETEVVIPVASNLLKEKNELRFAVQHFSSADSPSTELWTEVHHRSFLAVRCDDATPVLDLRLLPYPLVDLHASRDQRLGLLLPERISTETLEATALLVANLAARSAQFGRGFAEVRLIRALRGLTSPALVVGTLEEHPQLTQVRSRIPIFDQIRTLKPSDGVAALISRSESETQPLLIITANSAFGVVSAAKGVFDVHSENPTAVARISATAFRSPSSREWRGFVPPRSHFTLKDLTDDAIDIVPGERGAALVRLDATPDARFLANGLQARLNFDVARVEGSEKSFFEVMLNDTSLGRFPLQDILAGTHASLLVNAPGHLLRNHNVLKVRWTAAQDSIDGEGKLLPSSEFYLPRYYEARLPDLSMLRQQFYPFSLNADLADTVIVVPETIDEEIIAALVHLSLNLGRRIPSDNIAFKVKRSSEFSGLTRFGSHAIVLQLERAKGAAPSVEEIPAPWDPRKFVLKFSAQSSTGLRQLIERVFSDGVFNRLEGDAVVFSTAQPVMRRAANARLFTENFYFTRIEAWLRSNWLVLPLILGAVSVLMFIALRIALHQYRTRSNGAI